MNTGTPKQFAIAVENKIKELTGEDFTEELTESKTIKLDKNELDILFDIAEKYSATSYEPGSHKYDEDLQKEMYDICNTFNVKPEEAKQLMIDYLGFTKDMFSSSTPYSKSNYNESKSIKEEYEVPKGWEKDNSTYNRYIYSDDIFFASASISNAIKDPHNIQTIILILDKHNPDNAEQIIDYVQVKDIESEWDNVLINTVKKAQQVMDSKIDKLDESKSKIANIIKESINLYDSWEEAVMDVLDKQGYNTSSKNTINYAESAAELLNFSDTSPNYASALDWYNETTVNYPEDLMDLPKKGNIKESLNNKKKSSKLNESISKPYGIKSCDDDITSLKNLIL